MGSEWDNVVINNSDQISMADSDKIIRDLQDIHDQQSRILSYLENDPKTGRHGLVTDLELLKKDVTDMRNTFVTFLAEYRQAQAVKYAKNVVWGAVGAGMVAVGWWLIKLIAAAIMKIKFGI